MLALRTSSALRSQHLGRRDFLQLGALGGLSLALPTTVRAEPKSTSFGKARRCLLLFLTGGPSQLETFDPKPDAPAEVRGEGKPIRTSVSGTQISAFFPRLARLAHRYCIVRSVTHGDRAHTSAGYTMLTGAVHTAANKEGMGMASPGPEDHPHLGSILAQERADRRGPPAFVALPEIIKDANVNEFPGLGGGFLGKAQDPLLIETDPEKREFRPPELVLPADITGQRLGDRQMLRDLLDQPRRQLASSAATDVDSRYRQAFDLLDRPAVQHAFRLEREADRLREAYGAHLFGQGCLLARRLLEAGVALVSVYWHYEGPEDSPVWDTHGNNFKHMRERLAPPADQAIATLLEDLHGRGLLDDTLVIVMGEFGRSPRINKEAGRDHWPSVQSILLAGAGIRAGTVYGASDRWAAYPSLNPVSPPQLMATFLHLLGVPDDLMLRDRAGRPIKACGGQPVRELLISGGTP